MTGLLTQHALRALNVPVSSADAEAERALDRRPITNWCVLVDSLSEESVKEFCSAACNYSMPLNRQTIFKFPFHWNGNLSVEIKFTASLQRS